MKKRKIIKGVFASALALMLVFVCVFATACDTVGYERRVANFRPYDFTAYENAYEKADTALRGNNLISLSFAVSGLVKELNKIMGDYVMVQIEYSKDTEGEFKQYYKDYNKYYNDARTLYFTFLYNALNSQYGQDLFGDMSNGDIDMIVSQYNLMTNAEYAKIQSNITDLEMKYNSLKPGKNEHDANAAQKILLKLVEQNNKLAEIEGRDSDDGYSGYIEYAYDGYGRSYSYLDATEMCRYVKEYISPLISRFGDVLASDRATVTIPYEALVGDEIQNRAEYIEKYTKEIGSYMNNAYRYMNSNKLHYSANAIRNPNGQKGAFTAYLYNSNAPYVYQYCSGGYGDLMTYIHEFGHFTSFKNNGSLGGAELDVAEIQSQGNEMLFMPYLSEIYGKEAGAYFEENEIYTMLTSAVIMGCLLDEFQREIYTHPESYTADGAMTALFESLLTEYHAESIADRTGDPDSFKYWWAVVSHTFTSPFYYISYAVSALPALVIYMDANTPSVGRTTAIKEYNYIQQYGHGNEGGLTLEHLLSGAGIGSPFRETTIKNLASFIEKKFL